MSAKFLPEDSGIETRSFGCRLNLWESEVMRGLAREAGIADALIVNSCAVTAEAEREAVRFVRRAHREAPERPIIVTGCAAQLRPDLFADLPGVARILGNGVKLSAPAWRGGDRVDVPDVMALSETAHHLTDGIAGHTRGFLQVQQGCDHRCTFCVIPLARGPSRSVPVDQAIAAASRLVATGHREVVLTGVDLTAWGLDAPGNLGLGDLAAALLAEVRGLERLRLSSLDPAEIDEPLWSLLADDERLMPHFHLSVQSGDDLILKRMKRRHNRAQVIEVADRARQIRPGMAIGADLIAGFPTETDEQFANSLALIEEAGLDLLHIFPYSARSETPAARMPPVPGAIVSDRAAQLRAAGNRRLAGRLDRLAGRIEPVLMERNGIGRTRCFAPVRPDGAAHAIAPGQILAVRLGARQGLYLTGAIV